MARAGRADARRHATRSMHLPHPQAGRGGAASAPSRGGIRLPFGQRLKKKNHHYSRMEGLPGSPLKKVSFFQLFVRPGAAAPDRAGTLTEFRRPSRRPRADPRAETRRGHPPRGGARGAERPAAGPAAPAAPRRPRRARTRPISGARRSGRPQGAPGRWAADFPAPPGTGIGDPRESPGRAPPCRVRRGECTLFSMAQYGMPTRWAPSSR